MIPPALSQALPHLAGFLPAGAPPGLWLRGLPHPPARAGLLLAEALFRAPRFGRHHAPVALLALAEADPRAEPLALALAQPAPPHAEAVAVLALLREYRVGGAPGLPDPGPAGLDLPPGEAMLVLDPGLPNLRAAGQAMLGRAVAGGRPLLLALDPAAPPNARPVLRPPPGARVLPGRLAPWTLLDLAHEVLGLGVETELLALFAGRTQPGALSAEAAMAALLARTRWADPFRARPWTATQGLHQLAEWRRAEAETRGIVACTGMEVFKRPAVLAHLASSGPPPRIHARGSAAISAARRQGGAVAVWSAAMPPGLPAQAAIAGVPLVQLEDGFLRSAGLGVSLAPPLSLVLDGQGMHFDPATPSALETLLAETEFDEPLLARARALRQALLAAGLSKYNLTGAAALPVPQDRPVLLVVGQVAGDASLRRGGGRLRDNAALLAAVRRAYPAAHILYRPHPDVVAGMRQGAIAAAEADALVPHAPLPSLLERVDAVHVMSSLLGFEALLRGRRVVTWGQPFYAGWGLTEDHDPPPRRGRALSLDALVAAALILYPRYRDPRTGLPCPVEVVVERLAEAGPAAPPRPGPLARRLRGWLAAASGAGAEFWVKR